MPGSRGARTRARPSFLSGQLRGQRREPSRGWPPHQRGLNRCRCRGRPDRRTRSGCRLTSEPSRLASPLGAGGLPRPSRQAGRRPAWPRTGCANDDGRPTTCPVRLRRATLQFGSALHHECPARSDAREMRCRSRVPGRSSRLSGCHEVPAERRYVPAYERGCAAEHRSHVRRDR